MILKRNKLDKERPFLTPFSYWVIKDKLAAGEYPGNQYSFNPATTIATLAHQFVAMRRYGLKVNNFEDIQDSKEPGIKKSKPTFFENWSKTFLNFLLNE